jgi:hypothetical protein
VYGGSIEDKLDLSFRVFDADNSGYLTPDEIEAIFIMAIKSKTRLQANEKKVFSKVAFADSCR